MNCEPEPRQRYIVVFEKNAIDLEEKLNDALSSAKTSSRIEKS